MNSTPSRPTIGLIPCYLKLYDDIRPEIRAGFDEHLQRIAAALERRGIAVRQTPVCRIAPEFQAAVAQCEAAGVDALATLHLAYSPSLEALDALCGTPLPLLLLDTTPDAAFGPGVEAARIMFNHGVHGVMDLASMLRRRRRAFDIVAGHMDDPRTPDRAAGWAHAAVAAQALGRSRILRLGPAFAGMGDFSVPDETLRRTLGIEVQDAGLDALDQAIGTVSDDAVRREQDADRDRFNCELNPADHERALRVGLGLRRLLETGGCNGMSVNFEGFNRRDRPASTMPFLEIAKAMGRGVGYAGEGDVLTAALVGALARSFGRTTFTEIFCADWTGDSLFLSHMGELSPSVIAGRARLATKPAFGGGSEDPAFLSGAVQPGPAVFTNLVPGPDDRFALLVAPVEVLDEGAALHPSLRGVVRAWIRPAYPVAEFLERYSRLGGTHHSALTLGGNAEAIAAFGRLCGLDTTVLAPGA